MPSVRRIVLSAFILLSLTGCYKTVVGTYDDSKLKETKASWGVPQFRPVVWGFTGIPRDCKDCPTQKKP